MSRPALATLDDLDDLLSGTGLSDFDMNRATVLLAQASEIVRAYAGLTWLNDDEDDVEDVPGQIPDIVTAMVERATRNPDGSTQESAGPFARSFGADAAQRLYLTRWEKMVVRAAAEKNAVGTLATSRGPLETPAVYGSGYVTLPPAQAEYGPFTL